MSLTALVAAYDADAGGLRALRPLAGVTLLEHQVRRLAAAGIGRVVLLLEAWPAALTVPLQRLRADRIAIETAASVADAADLLATEPRLLLVADGCLPTQRSIEAMAAGSPPALAVLPDVAGNEGFERIDADARWAGLAMIDGAALVEMAAMVGDWDPISTLLRRAVQHGAARLDAGDHRPILAAQQDAVATAEAELIRGSRPAPRGWAARFIEAPLAELLLPRLFAHNVPPDWAGIAAPMLAGTGGLIAVGGYPLLGLCVALPTGILARIADRLALIQARPLRHGRWLRLARLAGLAIGAFGIGAWLRNYDAQWGWLLLAALLIAALAGLATLRPPAGQDEARRPAWLARRTAMPWLLVPFGITGRWDWGLAATALYALGSFGWVIFRTGRDHTG